MSEITRPSITVPAGEAPGQLRIEDLVVGGGAEATKGQIAEVHYAGVAWSNGQEFDASWNRNETFKFKLGASQVINGWDQGVQGMRIGGRRQLTIPPALGYGSRGASGVIKGGETLIFVVDLMGLR